MSASNTGFYLVNFGICGTDAYSILPADSLELEGGVPSSSDWFATSEDAIAAYNEAIEA